MSEVDNILLIFFKELKFYHKSLSTTAQLDFKNLSLFSAKKMSHKEEPRLCKDGLNLRRIVYNLVWELIRMLLCDAKIPENYVSTMFVYVTRCTQHGKVFAEIFASAHAMCGKFRVFASSFLRDSIHNINITQSKTIA